MARGDLLKRIGIDKEEMKCGRERGNQEIVNTVLTKIWRKEKEGRRKKIKESKYNNIYEDIITEDLPKYLQGKMKKDRSLITRYRCGNELRGSQYWREIEERICRVCGRGEENLTYVLKECEATRITYKVKIF